MKRYDVSDKMTEEYAKYSVYCKNCGHTMHFFPFEKRDKKICDWCQHTVYANDKVEFKEKLKKVIGNGRNL